MPAKGSGAGPVSKQRMMELQMREIVRELAKCEPLSDDWNLLIKSASDIVREEIKEKPVMQRRLEKEGSFEKLVAKRLEEVEQKVVVKERSLKVAHAARSTKAKARREEKAAAIAPPQPQGPRMLYGREWPHSWSPLQIELWCFRNARSEEEGGLGKFGHAKRVIDMLWNREGSPKPFIWSPWAEDMIRQACEHDYLAVGGCAGSGKSATFGVWAILQYLCSPANTLVIVTSTTLREARKRIWKEITELWLAAPGLPGKLVDSLGQIKGATRTGEVTDACGILLVPSEKKREREAIGKLIGMHNERIILVGDELPELPVSIIDAAFTNLSRNPYFQFIGLGNPASRWDAFGILSKPKDGWDSVSEHDDEWETSRGKYVRYSATKSPNIIANKVIYPWLPTAEEMAQVAYDYGLESRQYKRMFLAYFSDSAEDSMIYSESDLIYSGAMTRGMFKSPPVMVAGLDPGYTNGGDRTVLYFGALGTDLNGSTVLELRDYVILHENTSDKETPRGFQIAQALIDECRKRGVPARNLGIDATGAGGMFCDIVAREWSHDFLRVDFGGKASETPVSANDRTPGCEKYGNRRAEIWFSAKELLRTRQLRGISDDLAREICGVQEHRNPDGSTPKYLKVEAKTITKSRIGKSPDIADAAFLVVDVCRQRFSLTGGERFEANRDRQQAWRNSMQRLDVFSASQRWLEKA